MSKICILVFKENEHLISKLKKAAENSNLGIFFYDRIKEAFDDEHKGFVKASLSDNKVYDNCEMLLLPDDWYFNGRKNPKPFMSRMMIIRDLVSIIQSSNQNVELYVGESGVEENDFLEIECDANNLPNVMDEFYYSKDTCVESNLHICISNVVSNL